VQHGTRVIWSWEREETIHFHKMGALLCTLFNLEIYGPTDETRLSDKDVREFIKRHILTLPLILKTDGQVTIGV
jgi:hypothetical protein